MQQAASSPAEPQVEALPSLRFYERVMSTRWLVTSRERHIDYCRWLEERARRAENDGRLEAAQTIRRTLCREERRFRRPIVRLANGLSDTMQLIVHGLALLRLGRRTSIEG